MTTEESDMLKATRAIAEGIEKARRLDEIERANRDMMCGLIGGEEWRKRMRDIARDEMTGECLPRLRWVNCEECAGTGEIVRGPPGEPYNEYTELCPACEGTGRDCE